MEGKAEDGYLVAVSPRSTPPSRRKTLTQLVQEERLGSLKYLITSSPPSSSRPPRAAAPTPGRGTLGTITTPARGPNRGTRHSRRSSRGNNEEEAAVDLVSRTRSLFSSAPSASADDRYTVGGLRLSREVVACRVHMHSRVVCFAAVKAAVAARVFCGYVTC